MVNISRQLRIDLITDTPNSIIDWFNGLWFNMHVIKKNFYHIDGGEVIYYIERSGIKIVIFYRDDNNNRFWCNYEYYWLAMQNLYKINHVDCKKITKILVDNVLGNNILSIDDIIAVDGSILHNALTYDR